MTRTIVAAVGVMSILGTGTAADTPAPAPLAAIGVDEQPGRQLPVAVPFRTPGDGAVTLGKYLDGKRPMLLVLAYARCTMLCNVVLRGVSEAVARLAGVPGRDFALVVVGLDPDETIDEASRRQAALLATIGHGDRAAWPYLVGERASIDAVATALGFRYAWDPRTEQYAHPAVIFAVTPDGRISRYLHGVRFEPATVEAALADAAAGRVQSPTTTDVLRCFRFDPAARTAGTAAELFLRIGAAFVFGALVAGIAWLIVWQRRRGGAA